MKMITIADQVKFQEIFINLVKGMGLNPMSDPECWISRKGYLTCEVNISNEVRERIQTKKVTSMGIVAIYSNGDKIIGVLIR